MTFVCAASGLSRKELFNDAEKLSYFLHHRQAKDSIVPREGVVDLMRTSYV